jgi:hypothetical protein
MAIIADITVKMPENTAATMGKLVAEKAIVRMKNIAARIMLIVKPSLAVICSSYVAMMAIQTWS